MKYIAPEMDMKVLMAADVITTSPDPSVPPTTEEDEW